MIGKGDVLLNLRNHQFQRVILGIHRALGQGCIELAEGDGRGNGTQTLPNSDVQIALHHTHFHTLQISRGMNFLVGTQLTVGATLKIA